MNARGRYYVDQEACLFSGNCVYVAPALFALDEENMTYLVRQPGTPEEEASCRLAMRECPVEAIRDDGAP